MNHEKTFDGSCFCGAVQFTATGAPVAMGYCHCESCRHWSACPVNAFTLWKPEALKVTNGIENIGTYHKTPKSFRKWCKVCGGHLFAEHPSFGLIDIYAPSIPTLSFEPKLHVHYQETVLRMKDGLPKWKDVPEELGGSGVEIKE
jgi:hypothetical protein